MRIQIIKRNLTPRRAIRFYLIIACQFLAHSCKSERLEDRFLPLAMVPQQDLEDPSNFDILNINSEIDSPITVTAALVGDLSSVSENSRAEELLFTDPATKKESLIQIRYELDKARSSRVEKIIEDGLQIQKDQKIFHGIWQSPCIQGARTIIDLRNLNRISLFHIRFSDLNCTTKRKIHESIGKATITPKGVPHGYFDIDISQTKAQITLYSPEEVEEYNDNNEFGVSEWRVKKSIDVSESRELEAMIEQTQYGSFWINSGSLYVWRNLSKSPTDRVNDLNLTIPFKKISVKDFRKIKP